MDTPHNITMIAPFGIRPKGTLLARMLPLAKALTRDGLRVVIVAPPVHNPQDAGTQCVYDGVTVIHTASPKLPGLLGELEQARLLVQAVLHANPSCIYLFKPKGHAGLAAQWVHWWHPSIPLVIDCDDREGTGGWNDILPYPPATKWLFDWQERTMPRHADAVTVASRTLQSLCWADGCSGDRIVYVPNAADLAGVAPLLSSKDPFRLVLYTRFWEFDCATLIPVLAQVCAAEERVHVDVIGAGENAEEQTFARLIAEAGLTQRVTMHGWLHPEAIAPLLQQASIALVPVADTLINRARCSAKLLELLGAGIVVVGHDVGEMRTFVTSAVNGILVPAGDTDVYAATVVGCMQDHHVLAAMQEAAIASARTHHWDARVAPCRAALQLATEHALERTRL